MYVCVYVDIKTLATNINLIKINLHQQRDKVKRKHLGRGERGALGKRKYS